MRAVQYHVHGGSDVLRIETVAEPHAGPGQVRVAVAASVVNPADLIARQGMFGPVIAASDTYRPGWDFAGHIDEVGSGVDPNRLGESVIGMTNWLVDLNGTHADFVVVAQDLAVTAPTTLTAHQAATLPVNASTALQALDMMALPDQSTVVIVGAAGAVGGFATELARILGHRVIGIGRGQDEAFIRDRGAVFAADIDQAIRELHALGLGGADGLFDTAVIGAQALTALRDNGSYVGVIPPLLPATERGISVASVGVTADQGSLRRVVSEAQAGRLTPRIAATFPLADAALAHDTRAGSLRGAVVLDIASGRER